MGTGNEKMKNNFANVKYHVANISTIVLINNSVKEKFVKLSFKRSFRMG